MARDLKITRIVTTHFDYEIVDPMRTGDYADWIEEPVAESSVVAEAGA